ncbi:DUF3977 family protein [Paenibacillus caui]|uniref:DUF3977 family protein n=1 Tax=Paenibacillus caui TaxID=2873927 RepID=UPI001CA9A8D7|nr:DUF3977 family protein [Paenibacillus caui]
MKKYIEVGYGNRWLIRTEIENPDGTEAEFKGIIKPFKLESIYLRVWIGYKVLVIDMKDGIKINRKQRKCIKLILGFSGI